MDSESQGHTLPTSAVTLFATSPDLVFCLTDAITQKKQLVALRLVNTVFYAAATPRFFRSFRITHADDHKQLMTNQALSFMRSITI
ncbi:hypothetical protein B0T18DRAFT_423376 [Schizothecium vesticola]|uniref:Uncharacterized protein n=1 Tax=Schizothecium vesticola TaxID=314040 RepID=A0AA40F7M5_9PEZI|nr:hypothetical protein B0T18DRAFT_423376 [Schizothecium vesticola]